MLVVSVELPSLGVVMVVVGAPNNLVDSGVLVVVKIDEPNEILTADEAALESANPLDVVTVLVEPNPLAVLAVVVDNR